MTIRTLSATLTVSLCFATLAFGGSQPKPAATVLSDAVAKAKHEHKSVLFGFHATWCSWCHRLDKFLNSDGIKPIVDRHLEIVWIDGMERTPEKKAQYENSGWERLMDQYGAKEAGLPAFFILNGKGETMASSIRPKEKGGNTGYPGEPDEIAHFIGMMKAAGMTDAEQSTLKLKLEELAKTLPH